MTWPAGPLALPAPAKTAVLLDQLAKHEASQDKVLVFTAFRQTLDHMAGHLTTAGIPAATYHGSLPRAAKERAIAAFRDEVPVLLSTESAGEGRNLQFCHVMVNMDLPWNPMQIEQRLGRLHRVGQDHDVLLTNLVASGTIEEQVLRVLEAKINLFELVVGELDMILGRIDDDFDFESTLFDAFVASGDDAEFGERMAVIGDDLARARTDYLASRAAIDNLVGEQSGEALTAVADPALGFWLRHVAAEGGLWEPAGDSRYVVLPPQLRDAYRLPEELRVTADPDVAREDGATLLAAGHPVLAEAADRVLACGDAGYLLLARPALTAAGT